MSSGSSKRSFSALQQSSPAPSPSPSSSSAPSPSPSPTVTSSSTPQTEKVAYNCARCGLPKKGHVCALAPKRPDNKKTKKEKSSYVCARCGLPKKGHICAHAPPTSTSAPSPVPNRRVVCKARDDKPLVAYAVEHSHSQRRTKSSPTVSLKRGDESNVFISFRDWWEGRHNLPPLLPPALRVVEHQSQANNDQVTLSDDGVVVPPYQCSVATIKHHVTANSGAPPDASSVLYLNAAGPVWCLAFAPELEAACCVKLSESSVNDNDPSHHLVRHLAVATSRVGWLSDEDGRVEGVYRHGVGNDKLHLVEECKDSLGDNLLQIWQVYEERHVRDPSEGKHASTLSSRLLYSIDVNADQRHCSGAGAHWQVAWCESPVILSALRQYSSFSGGNGDCSGYIGLAAVICGDGRCRIFLLPEKSRTNTDDCSTNDIPVLLADSLHRYELMAPDSYGSHSDDVRAVLTSVAWQPYVAPAAGMNGDVSDCSTANYTVRVVCGTSFGGVLVWDLPLCHLTGHQHTAVETVSPSSRCCSPVPTLSFHDLSLRAPSFAAKAAIVAVKFCPYNPNLILCGGYGCTIKVWDLRDRFRPLFCRTSQNWIYSCEWDPCGRGFYWGESASNVLHYEPLWWGSNLPTKHVPVGSIYSHRNLLGGVWNVHSALLQPVAIEALMTEGSDETSFMVSVSSDGSARLENRSSAIQKLWGGDTKNPETGLFQIVKVAEHIQDYSDKNEHMARTTEEEWAIQGEVTVVVNSKPEMRGIASKNETGKFLGVGEESVATPQVALHAVHSCDATTTGCQRLKPKNSFKGTNKKPVKSPGGAVGVGGRAGECIGISHSRLLAIGGAAGLIRLQRIEHHDAFR